MDKYTQAQVTEAGFDPSSWRKAKASNGGNGGCVWVNRSLESMGLIALGDWDKPELGAYIMTPEEWVPFREAMKAGEFG